jgi:outer membrane protein W
MLHTLSRLLVVALVLAFLFPAQPLYSQCCSTGSPVGASTHVGILNKNAVRVITFYRHSFSEAYYEGTKPSTDEIDMSDNAQYGFGGLTLEYGLTHKLTLQADAGYFFNKIVNFHNPALTDHNGQGMSNGTLMLKYGLYIDPVKLVEVTFGAGLKYPFSRQPATAPNGSALQLDARPSTNAFGFSGTLLLSKEFAPLSLRTFLLNRFEYNGFNINDYQTGKLFINSLFVSKKIAKRFFGIVQFRNEIHGKDVQDQSKETNTGYHLIVATPQLSYSIAGLWNLSLLYDIPVYKNYQGKQLTPQYSYAVSLSRDFSNCGLNRKK